MTLFPGSRQGSTLAVLPHLPAQQQRVLMGCRRAAIARNNKAARPLLGRAAAAWDYGAKEQNRTADTAIFSRMLYLLSYLGKVGEAGLEPATPSV